MKPFNLLNSLTVVAAVAVTSCSAPKMAQQSAVQDDVYATTAQAKVYVPQERPLISDQEKKVDDYYGTSDPYYDMDYASRINRFHYNAPWRPYFDNFYDRSYLYSYNMPWYGGYGFGGYGFGLGYNFGFYNPYWNNYYGYNYGYNNNYPYYFGGGYYGGGYLGNRPVYTNPNYGARPVRGRDNGSGYIPNRNLGSTQAGAGRARTDIYNQGNNPTRTSTTDNRPTRAATTESRPQRVEQTRPAYTPPPTSSGRESGSSSSGSGSSSGSSGGRPTRGGR